MSLRAFHLLFIGLSIVLAAFFGAWAIGQYRVEHRMVFMAAAVASLAGACGLALYGTVFQRKTRDL
jgi:membrane associated rhomboid family serine protease